MSLALSRIAWEAWFFRSALGQLSAISVARIVCIAPPFRGSADIPKVLIAGERDGWFGDEEGYRKLARSFPSVYQLVPSFDGVFVDFDTSETLDPFDLDNWQRNVAEPTSGFRADFLRNAEKFVRGDLAQFGGDSPAPMLGEQDFAKRYGNASLVLVGTGHDTTYQIPVVRSNQRNPDWFEFSEAKRDGHGNGRVHLKSAAIRGVTLAAFDTKKDHGKVCRDETIITATKDWLRTGRVLKRKPRISRNSVRRPGKEYFSEWNGEESTFAVHVIPLPK